MAHSPRLFIDGPLIARQAVPVDDKAANYLLRVMRLKPDSIVRAFNGQDGEWQTRLGVEGRRAWLKPEVCLRPQTTGVDLTLFFAPLKKTRTDFLVEKACELGVRHLRPVITDYGQTSRIRTDRLSATMIEAAEQTERLDVPTISDIKPLMSALSDWQSDGSVFFCDEGGDAKPMQQALIEIARQGKGDMPSGGLLIGPEGGFSVRERETLRSLDFVIPVTLGPRILRAETAVVSALTLWQSQVGDWGECPYVAATE